MTACEGLDDPISDAFHIIEKLFSFRLRGVIDVHLTRQAELVGRKWGRALLHSVPHARDTMLEIVSIYCVGSKNISDNADPKMYHRTTQPLREQAKPKVLFPLARLGSRASS